MINHFYISQYLPTIEHAKNYQRCLIAGNWMMLMSLMTMLTCIAIAYGFEQHMPMPVLISVHLLIILTAGSLKIGYVMRLTALKAFGIRA